MEFHYYIFLSIDVDYIQLHYFEIDYTSLNDYTRLSHWKINLLRLCSKITIYR